MTFIIDNLNSLMYILLISTQQINDFNLKKFNFKHTIYLHDENSNASNGESSSHKYDAKPTRENSMKPIISISPCAYYANLKPFNHSFSILSLETYEKLLETRSKITNILNQIKLSLKKKNIINIVQEKKLGKNGNSYYYQKSVKKLDIASNIYVSFEPRVELNPVYFNPNESNCDHLELTLFDTETNFMVRKNIQKDFIDSIKQTYYSKKVKKIKADVCSLPQSHPILELVSMTKSINNSIYVKKAKKVDAAKQPEFRFHFRYELDKISEINLLLQTYIKLASIENDFVLSYAVIQKRATGDLFMHLKTNSGLIYLNYLELFPNRPNDYIFRFKKSNSLTLRIKSMELWNILKYEVYVPETNCSDYLSGKNCRIENHKLVEKLNRREPIHKYTEVFNHLFSNNEAEQNIDHHRCVFLEYFGKILTCNGKVISAKEYGILKTNDIHFTGLLLMKNGAAKVVQIDENGVVFRSREEQTSIGSEFIFNKQGICHQCSKYNLRAKAEQNLAYNQYKQAIKINSEKTEKYIILFLIFLVLSMFWFKKNKRKPR